ncbi:MAG: SsrA-binding protein SmpB [Deltaproteobacteria bacterium]|nr:SsrA-binding protein SmpB [Sandaracinaceae bacterium]MCX7807095.1 SsrA-binding protein SmpB [Deltaproteobacteria bacterium]MDW8245108.1 SsrA-binding protein SmpB [Sandaracinaceae bacterium]
MATKQQSQFERLVARNPRVEQRFEIEERLEAGLVLTGSEVKSLRAGHVSLEGGYATIEDDGCFLCDVYFAPYSQSGVWGHDPRRKRRLLLHRREIERWRGRVAMKGYTIVPLRIYFKQRWAKVELGLAKGKKIHDQRERIRAEIARNEAREAMQRFKGGR